jgi:hypothetical protein
MCLRQRYGENRETCGRHRPRSRWEQGRTHFSRIRSPAIHEERLLGRRGRDGPAIDWRFAHSRPSGRNHHRDRGVSSFRSRLTQFSGTNAAHHFSVRTDRACVRLSLAWAALVPVLRVRARPRSRRADSGVGTDTIRACHAASPRCARPASAVHWTRSIVSGPGHRSRTGWHLSAETTVSPLASHRTTADRRRPPDRHHQSHRLALAVRAPRLSLSQPHFFLPNSVGFS